jgi:hypothetical protein
MSLLRCLADNPSVWVPMTATVSDEDLENILRTGVGGTVTTKHQIRMKPDILMTGDGKKFFPAFSRKEEAPEDYRGHFSWVSLPFENVAAMVMQREELAGLVLNAFSESVVLVREIVAIVHAMMQNKE